MKGEREKRPAPAATGDGPKNNSLRPHPTDGEIGKQLAFDLLKEHRRALIVEASEALRLALRPKEAAKALGIGERLLWSKTNAGEIPHCRIGKAVLYPVAELERFLAEQVKGATR